MRGIIFAAALVFGPATLANELDREATTPNFSAEQIERAKELPQTVIVRVKIDDPKHVEVVHLAQRLKPGQKLDNLAFEKMALNAEKVGVAYAPKNELDKTTSTPSWRFGWGGGWGGMGGWGMGGMGMGWGMGCGCGWGGGAYMNPAFYPGFAYGGYGYGYAPYWGYMSGGYMYGYTGWGGMGGLGGYL